MNRIDQKFRQLRAARKKAFIAFITAGDPSLKATADLAVALGEAGADVIELGVPFSDPMADGPTIQAASCRSLKRGTTVKKILDSVSVIRKRSQVPLALMSYYNPILKFGVERFVAQAKAAGVDGLIIPDLPVDEAGELRAAALKNGIATIFFLAPTTTRERMLPVIKESSGFIYFVAVAGVTGARSSIPAELARQVKLARALTSKPVCVGFGISTSAQVKAVGSFSDGVIVGSAIVKEVVRHSRSKDMPARVARFVKRLKGAL